MVGLRTVPKLTKAQCTEMYDKIYAGGLTEDNKIGSGAYGSCYLVTLSGQQFVIKRQLVDDAIDEMRNHLTVWEWVEDKYLKYYAKPYIFEPQPGHMRDKDNYGFLVRVEREPAENSNTNNNSQKTVNPQKPVKMEDVTIAYSAQEYLVGFRTLRDHIDKLGGGKDPHRELIAINIAHALVGLHSISLLHCDVNSRNLMINHKMDVKVIDFGISLDFGDFYTNKRKSIFSNAFVASYKPWYAVPTELRAQYTHRVLVEKYPVHKAYESIADESNVKRLYNLAYHKPIKGDKTNIEIARFRKAKANLALLIEKQRKRGIGQSQPWPIDLDKSLESQGVFPKAYHTPFPKKL